MALHIDILTLFPRMLDGFLAESILEGIGPWFAHGQSA